MPPEEGGIRENLQPCTQLTSVCGRRLRQRPYIAGVAASPEGEFPMVRQQQEQVFMAEAQVLLT